MDLPGIDFAAFNIDSGMATLISAVILAGITGYYAIETRLIRKTAQNPSFSLEPSLYALGGRFYFLLSANTGQAATNIKVDCS